MATFFNNELVLQLINVYKNYALLWDPTHRDFKDRVKKNDAWEDIAKTMNMPRREVESKIHTLRSQFSREKKKVVLLRQSGRDDVKGSSWFAYDPMKFLLKGEDIGGLDSSDIQAQNSSDDPFPESFHAENFHIIAPEHFESTDTSTLPYSSKPSHRHSRKRTISYGEKSDETTGVYNFAAKHLNQNKSSQDELDIYAQYVASELRETKDLHSVLVAKRYINNILINARMGKYRASNSNRRDDIKSEHDILDIMSNHDHDE